MNFRERALFCSPFLTCSLIHNAGTGQRDGRARFDGHGAMDQAMRKFNTEGLSIPSFNYQMTPKISLNTRCSISISENLSINGQTRSSDQLGIWSYNINP